MDQETNNRYHPFGTADAAHPAGGWVGRTRLISWCRMAAMVPVLWVATHLVASPPSALAAPPYQLGIARDAVMLVTGLGLLGTGEWLKSGTSVPDLPRLDKEKILVLDRFAIGFHSGTADKLSDGFRDFSMVLTLLPLTVAVGTGQADGGHTVVTDVVMYTESFLICNGLTGIVKAAATRPRPFAYDTMIALEKRAQRSAAQSFWSGHATQAFNAATFAACVYQRRHPHSRFIKPVWALGLSCAATTAVLRVTAGQHFPTDVVAGAAIGACVGWLIPYLHEPKQRPVAVQASPGGVNLSVAF